MVDLAFLQKDSTLGIVDKHIALQTEKSRNYLGMSEIGDCPRKLWFKFHKGITEPKTARMLRLFDLGKLIEKRIIKELKTAGFKITGTQRKFKDFDGKFQGHCDGIVIGIPESSKPHILEIKSANEKNFGLLVKKGLQEHYPKYHIQAQCYMGYSGLDRCLFIVENKNDSSQYQERIYFDDKIFETAKLKAANILNGKYPPSGVDDWTCNYCHCNTPNICKSKNWEPF